MSDHTKIEIHTDPLLQRMSGVARHGMVPFDVPFISHIVENLWMGGCENGLVLPREIKHVVSLYPWERYEIRHEVGSELYVKAYDAEVEDLKPQLRRLVEWIKTCMKDGPTLVHCQAGLNRSGLLAAYTLTDMGIEGRVAIKMLRDKRSPAVLCNKSFERFILRQG